MFKLMVMVSLMTCGAAFAQDMSRTESYEMAHKNGSDNYVGRCTTHEDYEKKQFVVSKTLLDTIEPYYLSAVEIKQLENKFDKTLLRAFLKEAGQKNLGEFDDLTVENISHLSKSGLNLVRFNYGVGGGNGGYLIFNKTMKGSVPQFQLMSSTFDSDLTYCDKKVWR